MSSAWFVGYTPQMATAVMYVRGDGDDQLDGWLPSYFGADYPARTWTAIMQQDMEGLDVEEFPEPAHVDGDAPDTDHEPTPTSSSRPAGPSPTRRPSPDGHADHQEPTDEPTDSPTDMPTKTPTGVPTTEPTPTVVPTPHARADADGRADADRATDVAGARHRRRRQAAQHAPRASRRRAPRPATALTSWPSSSELPDGGQHGVDEEPVHPTHDDPGIRALSEGIGGPVGTHAGRHRWWTPVRVILALTAVCFALGLVKDAPCYHDKWSDSNTNYTHMCYSDLPYLYTGRGFAELHWPYIDDDAVRARYTAMEYPVVISYWAWWSAEVTLRLSGSPDLEERAGMPVDAVGALPEVRTGDAALRRGERDRVRRPGPAVGLAARRRPSAAAVGRRAVRDLARPWRWPGW